MDWKLGLLVHDATSHPWVYVGSRTTRSRTVERVFVKCEDGERPSAPPWTYRAVNRETLVRKFPDLGTLWTEESMG